MHQLKMIACGTAFFWAFCCAQLLAQKTFPQNGPYDQRDGLYAFTNATLFKTWNERIDNGTLLIRDGKVEACGKTVNIPPDAVVIDLKGKFVYPSFIDLYTEYGLAGQQAAQDQGGRAAFQRRVQSPLTNKKGAYNWNEALRTETRADELFVANSEKAREYRNLGFGAVLTHKMDGISRGTSALVMLGDEREHQLFLKQESAHHLSFKKGSANQDYPSSLMGCIALLRQTYYDAQWYKNQRDEYNISLKTWNDVLPLPQIFEVDNKLEALRAARLGKEFGVTYIIKGTGDEYQRLNEIKVTGAPFILPLSFPEPYEVEDPYDAQQVSLADLQHWELAPSNPGRLAQAGIDFALTTYGLKNKSDFFANLRKALDNGLKEDVALKALTHTPARLAGASDIAGSLEPGKVANFFIASDNIFGKDTKILHNWIHGKAYILQDLNPPFQIGSYSLTIGGEPYKLNIKTQTDKPECTVSKGADTLEIKAELSINNPLVTLSFAPQGENGRLIRLTGYIRDNAWSGKGNLTDGKWVDWSAAYTGPLPKKGDRKPDERKDSAENMPVSYPLGAYGWKTLPQAGTVLIRNATVWTNEKDGILKNTDVLIQNGKIAEVGKNINAPGANLVDGTNRHLTAGIIDEHSHIAISKGVNEGTQESSAEVRIGDVINPDDINIYRQLAGGVTSSHLLHGSANPIGGQTQLIKLRWGLGPEALKFEGWDGFIKFALGENVKQSNWGDNATTRFPQTRMGVEQVYDDYFTRAREYGELKKSGKPYRKDLDLETILEILEKKRFITCHSYVQSEINMLMKVAERFGFRINTFTHILEGYKVADKMARHGVAGSSFSDWWAYKYEVYDAIPYNGAIMHAEGVLTGFNSDDAEMARRLNQEAGKAVMYGKVPETEALKFVTLNPAKMLHVDNRTGSIKTGKDADLVLWSDHPLSVYAKADMTFVDGIRYFDRQEDARMREEMARERSRLIQKMLIAKKGGAKTVPYQGRPRRLYHCDDDEDELSDRKQETTHRED